jgi:hypothetical protein
MIRKGLLTLTVAAGALMFASQANAGFVNFYDSIASGKVQKVDSGSKVFGSITATTGDQNGSAPMTIAHEGGSNPNELGIGVCGTNDTSTLCSKAEGTYDFSGNWNGQGDEIDNLGDNEFVKLSAAANVMTGTFLLGSFDNSMNEAGYVEYLDGSGVTQFVTFQHDGGSGASILAGADTTGTASIAATGGSFGGNVFTLILTDFGASLAQMVTFRAGCYVSDCGTDNDYLVAAAEVSQVPIPAALPLFLSALGGLGLIGWRRKGARTA